MTITVNEKEYEALNFAMEQVETEMESATNEDFLNIANTHIKALYDLIDKYKKAREKANLFQMARAEVSKRNRHLRPRDIDRLTRQVIKKMMEKQQ